jgi:arsenite/tail-anchored protein-transporting ATPase
MEQMVNTEFIFFSGKGGVGKTSMACTHAVRYADEGKRTLIVTTDPASNLADVFEQPIGHQVTPIAAFPTCIAMEIDPDKPPRNTSTAPWPPSGLPSRPRWCR